MPAIISPYAQYTKLPSQFPTEDSDLEIGVALGSPTAAPLLGQDPSRVPRTMATINSPAGAVPEQQAQQAQQAQQQQQQSKSTGLSRQISKRIPFLGRSKSKRMTSNNGGVNYSRPDPSQGNYTIGSATPSTPSPVHKPAPARAGKLKKPKLAARRSVTDPQAASSAGNAEQQTLAWRPGGLLDVEIPDIRLERYSVMFGSLLEKQQAAAAAGGLLARRQATLARIRAVEDDTRREHHHAELLRSRRATSPAVTPSSTPVAELPGDTAASGIDLAPLRIRSNTFPVFAREADCLSPQQAAAAVAAAKAEDGAEAEDQVDSPGTSLLSPGSQLSPGPDGDGRPLLRSRFHKPSVESISSPYFRQTTERENGTALSPPPSGPSTNRSAVSPSFTAAATATTTTITTTTMTGSAKQVDVPSRSTSLRHSKNPHHRVRVAPPPPQPNPKPTSREEELEDAAEVSIARQISISRGQRRFLEPLHERERRRARANQHIKAASQISLDDGDKRLAETKTATPTLVHPEQGPVLLGAAAAGHLQSPHQQHMYRRSELVTIEGVPS
ncbi:hypothetical protein ISF_05446 [Cordyceps fumosorosea ARSEF 2679]|uniref:Uncharacterized protein n=1 Tax=Cordyceps fumosorosea (strain ARSEF 2679) TaxID=1081104 RepID=A0A167U9X0_CORFA|nr:hypothetical protein ISF_05446 [Cordyceps fumosorosea ARSEF 2679]OAA61367.1 hypothetical protein ISF_05446 [Cordyceps fumosorosea ARSEF 2679]